VRPRMYSDHLYDDYYIQQAGNGLSVYGGVPHQQGHGLGSILAGLFRGAIPMLKNVGKAAGKQLIKSGLNVATDVLSGENVRQSLKKGAKEGALSLLQSQRGSGVRKIQKNLKRLMVRTSSVIPGNTTARARRKNRKRKVTRDIFE